ncbi:23S rRNA (adenine(2030)-N(6))-methyltransferase RlmJ [Oceaniglobus ichthyenteri]|uniref:23S rRNA (adenine(2030)-N(6))-methyltransferase RlmJ n=1 Tax=Oceaniglobus ichthyenteri TaxID=2136177 RepID=UPI000D3B1F07|nr:23S rRNA (adenine(2030)-N(6))-methyltransferase RlmJ [Oceaniglobus ichthyenteri]
MLSYQHGYHAGNLADVHKHTLLAWALSYLTRKDKPLSYIETHAGRGLYDLTAPEALKTGEAAAGITRVEPLLPPDHPYRVALAVVRAQHGATAYGGSPLIAEALLRDCDGIHLAELHPREHAALADISGGRLYKTDGLALAQSLLPPTPRRGLMLIDPSYEVKTEYAALAKLLPQLHAKWNVGVIMLWYPILVDNRHRAMVRSLTQAIPGALCHELRFAPARPGHGMHGSGVITVNPPWGMQDEARRLTQLFSDL